MTRRNGPVEPVMRTLTKRQLRELLDERARFLLGMSGTEFLRRYRSGRLENAPVEAPVTALARLVEGQ